MNAFYSKIMRFWSEDRSLTVMLILLLLFIFVFEPSLSQGKSGEIFINIVYSFFLFSGIYSVVKKKKYVIIGVVVAVIGLIINLLNIVSARSELIIHDFGAIFFNFFFAAAILMKTFESGEITFQRIEGSVAVYLLIGMLFAFVFQIIYVIAGAISFNNIGGPDLRGFIYYSFTTLTTMGYGDITPVHPLARSLATLEAIIGQLYPAILIARLVSMEFESSRRKKENIQTQKHGKNGDLPLLFFRYCMQ